MQFASNGSGASLAALYSLQLGGGLVPEPPACPCETVCLACQYAEALVTHGQGQLEDEDEGSSATSGLAQAVTLWKAVQLLFLAGKHAEAVKDSWGVAAAGTDAGHVSMQGSRMSATAAAAAMPPQAADASHLKAAPKSTLTPPTQEHTSAGTPAGTNGTLCSFRECTVCGPVQELGFSGAEEGLAGTVLEVVAPALTFLASAILQVRV